MSVILNVVSVDSMPERVKSPDTSLPESAPKVVPIYELVLVGSVLVSEARRYIVEAYSSVMPKENVSACAVPRKLPVFTLNTEVYEHGTDGLLPAKP